MSKPRRIRTPLLLLATVSAVVAIAAGCSKQGEGERCSIAANNSEDCEDGLICTQANTLVDSGGTPVDRCCPPMGEQIGDTRCLPGTGAPGTGGTGGTGGSGGTNSNGGSGASSEGGAAEGGLGSTGGSNSSGGSTGSGGTATGGNSSTGGDTGTGGA